MTRTKIPAAKSEGEEMLALQIRAERLPTPEREYAFHPVRKWRFDFAWLNKFIAVEVEGAVRSGGRHTRGSGFIADCNKYNEAASYGWRVLRFPTEQVRDGTAIATIKRVLA